MPYNFHPVNREQMYLMPPSMKEWLPKGDLSWFIVDVVEGLDLGAFYAKYRLDGRGGVAYEPSMLVTLLLYAYCVGERSSRKIERLCERDVAFRVIAGNQAPDHNTIARFRKDNIKALEDLFLQVLKLCAAAGLAKAGTVALDGTKIKANASLEANRTHESLTKEVAKMMAEADEVDAREDGLFGPDKRGDELPPELQDPTSRKARVKEALARLEREAAEEAARQQAKIDRREAEATETGVQPKGRAPAPPDPTPDPKAQANTTDPDSRIMKTRQGWVQGYNAQVVTNEHQIIYAAAVTQDANDFHQLHPMIDLAQANLAAIGHGSAMKVLLADAGYFSEQNMLETEDGDPELLIATKGDRKQRQEEAAAPSPRGRMPKTLTVQDWMRRKLRTKRGKELYRHRGHIVEGVFGQTKDGRDCDGFQMRGIYLADGEWSFICTTHNLLKLFRKGANVNR